MSLSLDPKQIELIRDVDRLKEKDQIEVARRVRAKQSSDRKIWFCKRGRSCTGDPHEGAPYQHARGDQWPPRGTSWDTWFYMSGRGAGKTAAGGHWTRQMAQTLGKGGRIALVGRRGKDVRQTMVEGPAGLKKACERVGETYDWKPALMEFTFENGCVAFGYSAEEPESLRGPEHDAAWLDEPCHMALIEDVWSNLGLGLRGQGIPGGAKVLLTSSPLPTKWTKERIAEKGQPILDADGTQMVDEEGELMFAPTTVLVSVPTSINLKNLDEGYKRRIINPLRGTRKGKQELDAQLLEDVEGALWEQVWLDRKRIRFDQMDRIVIAIDPAGSDRIQADLTGIIVAGRYGDRYCVFRDLSGHYTPEGWASAAIKLYHELDADAIVAERNFGAQMVKATLRNTLVDGERFKGHIIDVHARVGKKLRAEPISALYEQELVDHLEFADLAELEDEMLTWVPAVTKGSPNRVDALVWALTELSGKTQKPAKLARPRGSLKTPTARGHRGYRRSDLAA